MIDVNIHFFHSTPITEGATYRFIWYLQDIFICKNRKGSFRINTKKYYIQNGHTFKNKIVNIFDIKINTVHKEKSKYFTGLFNRKKIKICWEICVPVPWWPKMRARVEKVDIVIWNKFNASFILWKISIPDAISPSFVLLKIPLYSKKNWLTMLLFWFVKKTVLETTDLIYTHQSMFPKL